MANLIERTTTEEYDEDKRLTSRTVVEKYGAESKYETANKAFESVLDMPYTERNLLFEKVVKYCKRYEPCVFQSALQKLRAEMSAKNSWLGDVSTDAQDEE